LLSPNRSGEFSTSISNAAAFTRRARVRSPAAALSYIRPDKSSSRQALFRITLGFGWRTLSIRTMLDFAGELYSQDLRVLNELSELFRVELHLGYNALPLGVGSNQYLYVFAFLHQVDIHPLLVGL